MFRPSHPTIPPAGRSSGHTELHACAPNSFEVCPPARPGRPQLQPIGEGRRDNAGSYHHAQGTDTNCFALLPRPILPAASGDRLGHRVVLRGTSHCNCVCPNSSCGPCKGRLCYDCVATRLNMYAPEDADMAPVLTLFVSDLAYKDLMRGLDNREWEKARRPRKKRRREGSPREVPRPTRLRAYSSRTCTLRHLMAPPASLPCVPP